MHSLKLTLSFQISHVLTYLKIFHIGRARFPYVQSFVPKQIVFKCVIYYLNLQMSDKL